MLLCYMAIFRGVHLYNETMYWLYINCLQIVHIKTGAVYCHSDVYRLNHSPIRGVREYNIESVIMSEPGELSRYSWTKNWTAGVRLPAGSRDFFLLHSVQTGSGAHPASYPMGTRGCFGSETAGP
jgi:hypothetical protein